jgi:hypothetical protein
VFHIYQVARVAPPIVINMAVIAATTRQVPILNENFMTGEASYFWPAASNIETAG